MSLKFHSKIKALVTDACESNAFKAKGVFKQIVNLQEGTCSVHYFVNLADFALLLAKWEISSSVVSQTNVKLARISAHFPTNLK